jgi:hypothetical protein
MRFWISGNLTEATDLITGERGAKSKKNIAAPGDPTKDLLRCVMCFTTALQTLLQWFWISFLLVNSVQATAPRCQMKKSIIEARGSIQLKYN